MAVSVGSENAKCAICVTINSHPIQLLLRLGPVAFLAVLLGCARKVPKSVTLLGTNMMFQRLPSQNGLVLRGEALVHSTIRTLGKNRWIILDPFFSQERSDTQVKTVAMQYFQDVVATNSFRDNCGDAFTMTMPLLAREAEQNDARLFAGTAAIKTSFRTSGQAQILHNMVSWVSCCTLGEVSAFERTIRQEYASTNTKQARTCINDHALLFTACSKLYTWPMQTAERPVSTKTLQIRKTQEGQGVYII